MTSGDDILYDSVVPEDEFQKNAGHTPASYGKTSASQYGRICHTEPSSRPFAHAFSSTGLE